MGQENVVASNVCPCKAQSALQFSAQPMNSASSTTGAGCYDVAGTP